MGPGLSHDRPGATGGRACCSHTDAQTRVIEIQTRVQVRAFLAEVPGNAASLRLACE